MINEKFLRFIDEFSAHLPDYKEEMGEREHALIRMVKLNEEVGELCAEIISRYKMARPSKNDNYRDADLAFEIADVFITTALLAKVMNINVNEALENKMEKIRVKLMSQN